MTTNQHVRLGAHLAEIRMSHGWTTRDLAQQLKISHSKISKIENGQQPASKEYIEQLARVFGLSAIERKALTARVSILLESFSPFHPIADRWRMASNQRALHAIEVAATEIRAYQTSFIPGLLQSKKYAQAVFAAPMPTGEVPSRKQIEQAVRERVSRQAILHDREKRFLFIVSENALRSQIGSPTVMIDQLEYLASLNERRPGLLFGIIASRRISTFMMPLTSFDIFDDEYVSIEVDAGLLTLSEESSVRLYTHMFDQLQSSALYGSDCISLLRKIQKDYAALS